MTDRLVIRHLVPDMLEVQRTLLRREAQNPGRPRQEFNRIMLHRLLIMDVDEVMRIDKDVPKMKLHYCITYLTMNMETNRGYTLKVIPGVGYKIWRWK